MARCSVRRSAVLGLVGATLGLAASCGPHSGEPKARRPLAAASPAAAAAPVRVPRAWLEAEQALELLGRRAGLRYVVTAREADGLVGPFAVDQQLAAQDLLARVAKATGTELSWRGEVAVLQPAADAAAKAEFQRALGEVKSADPRVRRYAAFALGESCRLEAVAALNGVLGDKDRAVRRAAVLALAAFEGDFAHGQWAGRLSVFELPGVKLDTDSLLWLVEDAAETASDEWKAAVSVLARAREGQLTRDVWDAPWNRVPGGTVPAAWAMGRAGDPAARSTLEKRLRQPFTNAPADRYVVAAALGKLGLVGSLRDHAIRKEKGSQPADVRAAAVYGLGFCRGTKAALEALKEATGDPDSRVRELAAFALGETDTKESAEVLAKLLADEKADVALRAAAARALVRVSDEQAQEALFAAAKDKDARVRAAAAEALGERGGHRAQELLAGMFRDSDRWVVAAAGRALASIGRYPPKMVEDRSPDQWAGFGYLLIDPRADLEARIAVAVGLGQGRDPAAAAMLGRVALNPAADWRLRDYAVRSLAMLADRAGQPTLQKLIESQPPVRMTNLPLRYLDLGDAPKTVAYLSRWVTGGARDEQAQAVERIGELGTPEGTELLAGGANVFDNYTRCAHIWPLIDSRSPAVRAKLIELLKTSRRSGVRTSAALGLGGRQDPAAVDALIAACKDESGSVRKAAAQSLGQCGDPVAARALIEVMEGDADLSAAHQALRALRLREFAGLKEVREAFARVRGTERDAGTPGGPSLLEQPGNSWVLRKAPHDYDDLTVPDLTYESAMVYEPASGKAVQWGAHGRRADSPQTGRTWMYDAGANEWHRPVPRQEPPGICLTRGITADPVRGLVISPVSGAGGHGWVMSLRKNASYSVPWVFDSRKEQWYPMRPVKNPGAQGMVASCFDLRNDVMLIHSSSPRVYDAHANEWAATKPPEPRPQARSEQPGAYDPVTERFIVVADSDERGRAKTWAYDLRKDQWTELKPENPPPAMAVPMVYDSANDVMLAFRPEPGHLAVYVYQLRENRWQALPPGQPAPSYHNIDAAYDPANNVTVITGGWEWGQSGEVTVRETWTYRYRPAPPLDPKKPGAPGALHLEVSPEGRAILSWEAPAGGAPGGYAVYRAVGEHPWTARVERVTTAALKATAFTDLIKLEPDKLYYYRVRTLAADGKEGPGTPLARSQPLPVREVAAARAADGAVSLSWTPSASPNVVGYNVYRASGGKGDLWNGPFDLGKKVGEFAKLNAEPVAEASFADQPGGAVEPAGETSWAPFFVYVVRAVNAIGQESGPSPATLSIPAPPGPVVAAPLEDGRVLVTAGAEGAVPVRGRQLYRMDSYKGDWIFRMAGAPHPGNVFVDGQKWPRGDRSCYFVIAVDELGQLGVPSSEAWSRNAP